MKNPKKTALVNALLTTLYIVAIAAFMHYASDVKLGKDNQFLTTVAMLLLLVFSAAFTGYLVVGKPLQLYIDGKKKEGLYLLLTTFSFLFIITLTSLLLLIFLT